ncbi:MULTISPECIES: DUF2887 domain-containing protein [unclassified Chamaesiphon]|uniref:DUF2887 domain-containing protein n=1 Tax=unclassified Chamaesiphon TaxID=2620921 RepID=UPI00286AB57F|nr:MULTISPECIES: DUF2887 domain-containing protein [unclassified Chamaesiphon]
MVLTTIESEAATLAARSLIERSGGERTIIDLISTIIVYKFGNLTREEMDAIPPFQTASYAQALNVNEIGNFCYPFPVLTSSQPSSPS